MSDQTASVGSQGASQGDWAGWAAAGVDVPVAYYELPAGLAANAQMWLDAGGGTAVPTKDSSTVMLLREVTPRDVEVFVLRRAATMAFAASAYVFPGGGVDARDTDESLPWSGPSPRQWARRLAASTEAQARELVVTAARELFEECGVLLAGPDADTVVADLTGPAWDVARKQLVSRELSFAQFLLERGLVLRTDLLRAFDHWITPEFEPRRYDTRFFVAALPGGQIPDDDCTEAEHVRWVRPAELLSEHAAGQAMLLPPTEVSLRRLEHRRDAASEGDSDGDSVGDPGGDFDGDSGRDSSGGGGGGGAGWDGTVARLMALLDTDEPLPVVLPEPVVSDAGVRVARRWLAVPGERE